MPGAAPADGLPPPAKPSIDADDGDRLVDDIRFLGMEFYPDEEDDSLWVSSDEDSDIALEVAHYEDDQWGLRLRGIEVECGSLHHLETAFLKSITLEERNLLARIVNAWDLQSDK